MRNYDIRSSCLMFAASGSPPSSYLMCLVRVVASEPSGSTLAEVDALNVFLFLADVLFLRKETDSSQLHSRTAPPCIGDELVISLSRVEVSGV